MVKKSDSLKEYKAKRDLKKSGEPPAKKLNKKTSSKKLNSHEQKLKGKVKRRKPIRCPRYVIQEHDAKNLHWDLRLERDGVLKSWAVPKEPSSDPKIKRLAIQVEDHPLEYGKFHGEIKEGYGKGTVKIWDIGTYTLKNWDDKRIEFNIQGKKLKGMFVLIKTHYGNKPEKSWLFFKMKDD